MDIQKQRAELYYKVLSHFDGSPTRLAEYLGNTLETVCNWRARGIPANYAQAIARKTGMSVQELRPDDWHDYWPAKTRRSKATA